MANLAEAVDATETDWIISAELSDAIDYLTVESEIVKITANFPAQRDPQTRIMQVPRIRVERGAGGTTAVSHADVTALTPLIPPSAGAGGAGVTVDNQSDPPEAVDTLVMGAAFGPAGTATVTAIKDEDSVTGAYAQVAVVATEDNGQATVNAAAVDAVDGGADAHVLAQTDGGTALVNLKAEAVDGTANARLDAEAPTGTAEARVAVIAAGVPQIGVVASFVFGGAQSLTILDGAQGFAGNPGDALTAHATAGTAWEAPAKAAFVEPTTATAEDIANALIAAGLMDAS